MAKKSKKTTKTTETTTPTTKSTPSLAEQMGIEDKKLKEESTTEPIPESSPLVKLPTTFLINGRAFAYIKDIMGNNTKKTKEILTSLIRAKGLHESSMFIYGEGHHSSAWDVVHTDIDTYEICGMYKNNNHIVNLWTGEVRVLMVGRTPTQRRFVTTVASNG